jgi:type I restriction enzyme S subunit
MEVRERPLGSLFQRKKRVGYLDEAMLSVFRDRGVIRKDSRENLNKTAEDRSIYQLVEPGWLVVNRMKAWQGSVGIAFERGTVSGHYLCFRPVHAEDDRFLNHLLRSEPFRIQYASLSRGVRPGQAEIDNEWFKAIRVPLPPLDTQRRIANFLDDQVARLDALALETQKAVGKASSRRDATVRSLLLRNGRLLGVPPWISEIPRAWAVLPLRSRWAVIDCKHRTPTYIPDGIPVISPGDVKAGRLDVSTATRFVSTDDYRDLADDLRRCRVGDIVYSRNASAGTAAYVDDDRPFTMGQDVCRITSHAQDQLYLSYVLNYLVEAQLDSARLGSTFTRINIDAIKNLRVPVPPLPTQRALASECDRALAGWVTVDEELRRLIALFEERKRALITACVTGEFEVSTASARAGDAALAHLPPV